MSSPARVPGAVKGLALVSFWNDVASEMVFPLLPAFVTGVLGGSATMLAAIEGAADLASAGLKWVSGRLSDRAGWRIPLIVAGYATAILVRPINALATATGQVIAIRVLDRVGKGLRTAPRDALIADVTPAPLHGRAFGLHRAFDHVGAVFGSIVAWWLLSRGAGIREVIGASLIPGLVALVLVWLVLRSPAVKTAEAMSRPSVPQRSAGAGHLSAALLALAFLVLVRIPDVLLLLRVQQLGVDVALIPLVWGGLHVVRSLASYPGGGLSDRLGPRVTVAAGALLFAAIAFALSRALSPFGATLVFLAYGGVAGLTEPAERALVARLSPERRGSGFGGYNAVVGVAVLPAAMIFGWLYESIGASGALVASSALSVLAAATWGWGMQRDA